MGIAMPDEVRVGHKHIVYLISGGGGDYRMSIVRTGIHERTTQIESEWTSVPKDVYRSAGLLRDPAEVDAFAERRLKAA